MIGGDFEVEGHGDEQRSDRSTTELPERERRRALPRGSAEDEAGRGPGEKQVGDADERDQRGQSGPGDGDEVGGSLEEATAGDGDRLLNGLDFFLMPWLADFR